MMLWKPGRLAPSLSRMGFDRVYPVYYEISFVLRFKFKTDLVINKLDIPYQNPFERDLGASLETRQTSKLQYRRALFHVVLYLTVHKSFVSISLNIIHRGCTFYLSYPYWTVTLLYKNTMSSITVTVHKLTY